MTRPVSEEQSFSSHSLPKRRISFLFNLASCRYVESGSSNSLRSSSFSCSRRISATYSANSCSRRWICRREPRVLGASEPVVSAFVASEEGSAGGLSPEDSLEAVAAGARFSFFLAE